MNNKSNKLNILRNTLLGLAFAFIATEAGVRLCGLTDFPTYAVDKELGYIPKQRQLGSFLNKNSWVFNDRSMGSENKWNPQKAPNILLIGNSIVMGGNPYDQKDKLGPIIQRSMGDRYSVWPIAAGGWSNVNESVYLERNADVVKAADFFVWEYMYGGMSQLNQWPGEYVFPSEKPTFATWYVLRRYVLPRFINFNMNELPPTGVPDSINLAKFESAIAKLAVATGKKNPGILFIYPTKEQFVASTRGEEWLPEREMIEGIAARHGLTIVDISCRPEWNESLYREGTHPTVEGNAVIAKILTGAIKQALANLKGTRAGNLPPTSPAL